MKGFSVIIICTAFSLKMNYLFSLMVHDDVNDGPRTYDYRELDDLLPIHQLAVDPNSFLVRTVRYGSML